VLAVSSALVSLVLFAVGVLHLVPAWGVLGAERLARLYGALPPDPSLVLLLRHRALLFGVLGAFCCAAAFVRPWRWPALVAALVSTAGFVALAAGRAEAIAPALRRVVAADVIASAALAIATALWLLAERTGAA
jgi:hypothetical protein